MHKLSGLWLAGKIFDFFRGFSLAPCVMSVPGIRTALATTACGVCSHSAHAE